MGLFIDDSSDQSTCIYVDSSLNSSFSELNSSEFDSSELHSSSLGSSSSFSLNDRASDRTQMQTACLIRLEELEVMISIDNLDAVIVTEVFPKTSKSANIDRN